MNESEIDADILRKKAEEFLRNNSSGSELQFTEADVLKLVHELDVLRIKVEMQEEELLRAKEEAENATQKYNELFELHNRFIVHLLKHGKTLE
jgi:hypothetical protein